MAKSIRSSIKKRFRTVKRQRVEKMVDLPRRQACNAQLTRLMKGEVSTAKVAKNAFLYPNDPDAEIPQKTVKKQIDFRAETLPMAGFATAGNRRKYTDAERADLKQLSTQHPEQVVLAGKGALPANSSKVATTAHAGKFPMTVNATLNEKTATEAAAKAASSTNAGAVGLLAKGADADMADAVVDHTRVVDTTRKPVLKSTKAKKAVGKFKKGASNASTSTTGSGAESKKPASSSGFGGKDPEIKREAPKKQKTKKKFGAGKKK
eukprot:CAMPEP_0179006642 /NCGR_PEP_ID=MMETSP0795-20121207/14679_1 /TAXON_ID=88552 /ORGANISM="Amoebophrya sp., Strain Ameob2" /LENGTH=263 /DNA_ID=CAMNT_0020701449 /DNA_START=129 /DNA_END=919 /DNA_ORIENTATION=-